MPAPRISLISLLYLGVCVTNVSAQNADQPALIKLRTATMDADGDGIIDLSGETVCIRAAVTTEYFPAFIKDTREYRAYVQDRTGGIRLVSHRSKPLRDLVVGVEAQITGTLGQYRGSATATPSPTKFCSAPVSMRSSTSRSATKNCHNTSSSC